MKVEEVLKSKQKRGIGNRRPGFVQIGALVKEDHYYKIKTRADKLNVSLSQFIITGLDFLLEELDKPKGKSNL